MNAPVSMGCVYPKHGLEFACARSWGARMVRRGKSSRAAMIHALRIMARATDPNPADRAWSADQALAYELAVSIGADEVAAFHAIRDVARAISPLIDARAPGRAIRAAASHAAAGRLDPDEIADLIAREQAWWVRLHAQLEGAPRGQVPYAA